MTLDQDDINAIALAVWANERRDLTDGRLVQQPYTQGRVREIVKGDAYGAGQRQLIVQASDGGQWPATLDGRTWVFRLAKVNRIPNSSQVTLGPTLETACTVLNATGPTQSLRINLTSEQTFALAIGPYAYAVVGTDNVGEWTVELERVDVRDKPPAAAA